MPSLKNLRELCLGLIDPRASCDRPKATSLQNSRLQNLGCRGDSSLRRVTSITQNAPLTSEKEKKKTFIVQSK